MSRPANRLRSPRTWVLASASLLLLAACETPPALSPLLQDTSPERPTAVQESVVASSGFNGVAPFEARVVVLTRPDMRREQNTLRGTGTMSRLLVGNENRAEVTRLDLQRIWELDLGRGQYRECPLTGCASRRERDLERAPAPGGRLDPDCRMRVVSRDRQTRVTGAQQQIAGWTATQTQSVLTVVLEDHLSRRSTSTLTAEIWTTPVTAAMQAAQAIEQRFEQDAGRAKRSAAVRQVAPEFRELADSLLARAMSEQDRIALFGLERDLAGIGGQPVRTTLSWDVRGEACGGSGLGPAARLLGGAADAPLFAVTHELRRFEVAPVRDSQFYLPSNLQRAK